MKPIVMPKLGLTMTEGTIKKWLKSEGDSISSGDELLEIETDKSVATVESPYAGTLWKIRLPNEGETVEVGEPIAYLLESGEEAPDDSSIAPVANQAGKEEKDFAVKSSPAARKLARDLGLDVSSVPAGSDGVVHLAQVQHYQGHAQERGADTNAVRATPLAKLAAEDLGVNLSGLASDGERIRYAQVQTAAQGILAQEDDTALEHGDKAVPFTGVRKTIARRMTQCKQQVPHFYLSLHADMSKFQTLASGLSYRISMHDWLIRVLSVALAEHPEVNAHVYDDKVILKEKINVGIAVATENGLIVPVVRDVRGETLKSIAENSAALIQKARNGTLMPDDYHGATFTVSNLGMFEIEQFTAIIHQPEAAILAVGKAVDTVVTVDGKIVIRPMLALSASFDHRAIDGAAGAKFLKRVKALLETPELLI